MGPWALLAAEQLVRIWILQGNSGGLRTRTENASDNKLSLGELLAEHAHEWLLEVRPMALPEEVAVETYNGAALSELKAGFLVDLLGRLLD